MFGSFLGLLYFSFDQLVLRPHLYRAITSHPIARHWLIRDLSLCPDVAAAEYAATHSHKIGRV
jgi:hypothetical protein